MADVTSGGQSILAKKNVEREQVGEHARREKCSERNYLFIDNVPIWQQLDFYRTHNL